MILFNLCLWDKEVLSYPTGISPKINIAMRLEFELAYFEASVQHFNHYATETLSLFLIVFKQMGSCSFKNVTYKLFRLQIIYIFNVYMYKKDSAFNYLQ